MKKLINKLEAQGELNALEYKTLLDGLDSDSEKYLFERARSVCCKVYGKNIFVRGLIEITNYCKNDCYYCGIRKSNHSAQRYRLTKEEILDCCKNGYDIGFRTFVLQGGEDLKFSVDEICDIVKEIKEKYSTSAVTLSLGEKPREVYEKYRIAGADRYLLRHETANSTHYAKLHPPCLSLENRKKCLENLKELGFQTGCGFMVGSPYQTIDNIIEDLVFIKNFEPQMVGLGPFISHHDTPFANFPSGDVKLTLRLLSIVRLMNPCVLLPATTALATADNDGREQGILAGANVVMPNLSPVYVRKKYALYDNKACTGCESAEFYQDLQKRFEKIGYKISLSRGDYNIC